MGERDDSRTKYEASGAAKCGANRRSSAAKAPFSAPSTHHQRKMGTANIKKNRCAHLLGDIAPVRTATAWRCSVARSARRHRGGQTPTEQWGAPETNRAYFRARPLTGCTTVPDCRRHTARNTNWLPGPSTSVGRTEAPPCRVCANTTEISQAKRGGSKGGIKPTYISGTSVGVTHRFARDRKAATKGTQDVGNRI